jgi:hypothetical protein
MDDQNKFRNPNSKSKIPFVISIILNTLILIAIFFLFYNNKNISGVSSSLKVTSCNSSQICFQKHFSSCTPAIMVYSIFNLSVKYEVFGKKLSGCSVLFEYTKITNKGVNKTWVNKPMTCNFNSNQSFIKANMAAVVSLTVKKTNPYQCKGPLVKILIAQ